MNRFGRNTPAPAAHLRPTQLPAQWMKSPFIPLQSSIQSVLLSPKGNPVNTKDRSCFCLPKGFLFLLTLSSPLPFSHSFSPDTVRSVRSGCFSPRYSAIPPSGYSSLSQPFPSPGFISQREREREREERTSGAAQNTPLPTCRFQIGFLRVPYVRLRGHDRTCRGGRICNLRL